LSLSDWPLGPLATAWCFAALFAGYAVRGAAGFGSGVVATPLMAFVLPLSTVAPLVTFLGAFVSIRQAIRDWNLIAWRHIAAFVPGILIGVPLGIWVFRAASPAVVLKALGAYVVAYALYSLFGAKLGLGHWRMPRWAALPIGTLGAIVATLFGGMAGPVYVTWLDGLKLDKRVFRVTTSTTLFTLAIVRSIAYLAGGVFALGDFVLVAAAAIPVALGTVAGDRLHDRLDPETFRRLVGGVLVFSGAALLLT
jgi:uncharacterized membrane protein YfcA